MIGLRRRRKWEWRREWEEFITYSNKYVFYIYKEESRASTTHGNFYYVQNSQVIIFDRLQEIHVWNY